MTQSEDQATDTAACENAAMKPSEEITQLEAKERSEQIHRLGALLERAIRSASGGKKLTKAESEELSLWASGQDWFKRESFLTSEEEKITRAQTMLLGTDLRKALQRAANGGQLTREDRLELGQWLGSARRARRRYQLKLTRYVVVIAIAIFGMGLLLSALSKGLGLKDNPLTIPFLASIAVMSIAVFKDVVLDRSVDSALKELRVISEKAYVDINETIEKNLRPRIIPLQNREQVVRAACEILHNVTKEPEENRFVVFIGAASLSTAQHQEKDEEAKASPEAEYQIKLNRLEYNNVRVERYVALIEKDQINSRQDEILKRYEPWLQKQVELLDNNRGYVLKHCLRAQPYEGSRSSIITHKAVLDIVGYGDSGFLIKDEELARTIRQSSEDLFNSKAKIRATYYGGSDNRESRKELLALLDEVKKRKK